jgi:predicted ferric reductase
MLLHSVYVKDSRSFGTKAHTSHSTYIYGLSTFGVLERVLTEPQQYAGAVASLSMLLMLATAIGFVRKRQYETFYILHVLMAAVVLVAGMHSTPSKPRLR